MGLISADGTAPLFDLMFPRAPSYPEFVDTLARDRMARDKLQRDVQQRVDALQREREGTP